MKKVRRLTPSLLKRIISEEKQKLARSQKRKKTSRKRIRENKSNSSSSDLKKIKAIKRRQKMLINEIKKTIRQKKIIKKRLIRRL